MTAEGQHETDAERGGGAGTHLIDHLTDVSDKLPTAVRVQVAYEVIRLLSEQLYSSPAKAIEELVVNAWDADATVCSIHVPAAGAKGEAIIVFDNGHGMDEAGLRDLWTVGSSRKRDRDRRVHPKRKQIGKFGIGKLATYAIADRITYVTRTESDVLSVAVDFSRFAHSDPSGGVVPVDVDVLRPQRTALQLEETFVDIAALVRQDAAALCADGNQNWTFVVLEDLKPAAEKLSRGRLDWVLRTAMPLESKFALYLNGSRVLSVDEDVEWVVDFTVDELDAERLAELSEATEESWERRFFPADEPNGAVSSGHEPDGEWRLWCPSLEQGVSGRVRVAKESLYRMSTKRADLGRSHGFFIRVLGRLVNEDDPLFGLKPRSYEVFNRFAAQVRADDLDRDLTAPRESIERSETKLVFEELLRQLFGQARVRYQEHLREQAERERRKLESERSYVSSALVEHPVADAVAAAEVTEDEDEDWTLLHVDRDPEKVDALVRELYAEPELRRGYSYRYESRGDGERLVLFDPDDHLFVVNEDHPVVEEFAESGGRAKELVEIVATAEALLEVYLREAAVPPGQVRQLIERHDQLLRSLAQERAYAPRALAKALRGSQYHDKELEAAVVTSLRLLGFATRHISGSGTPDGIAEFYDGSRTVRLTLEAKASEDGSAPSLQRLGFDGLQSHAEANAAAGCLLVAPSYPGDPLTGEAATRARNARVSCWTVEQLAAVVEATERRHLTTRDILDIVLDQHAPGSVAQAVDQLLASPGWSRTELRAQVLEVVLSAIGRVADLQPTTESITFEVATRPGFSGVTREHVQDALETLVAGSAGGLHLSSDKRTVYLRVDEPELRRRVAALVAGDVTPRRPGPFREDKTDS